MHIYGKELPYSFHICAFWLLYIHIYRSQNAHIQKRAFVYADYGFCRCAYVEEKKCIYIRELSYMHIYERKKCAYTEAKMHIYGSQSAHIRKRDFVNLSSVYGHFVFCKCAYTEAKYAFTEAKMQALFRVCTFCLPYMRIYGRQNAHIHKLSSVYRASIVEPVVPIC